VGIFKLSVVTQIHRWLPKTTPYLGGEERGTEGTNLRGERVFSARQAVRKNGSALSPNHSLRSEDFFAARGQRIRIRFVTMEEAP